MRLRPAALSLIHGWDAGGGLGGAAETWSLQILTSDGTGLRSPGDIHKLSFPAMSEGSLMIQASDGVMVMASLLRAERAGHPGYK